MKLRNILLLILSLVFLITVIEFYKKFNYKYQEIIITECGYGSYLLPEKISFLNFSYNGEKTFIFVKGSNICNRNVFTSLKNFIIISEIDNKKYIYSDLKLECKDKEVYGISVECCTDTDCSNNGRCVNYVCEYKTDGQYKYVYVYPIFYYNPQIPKCRGLEINYNELIGEDVGEVCYTIEKIAINLSEVENNCIWVDGIRNINLFGNGNYEIVLKDYYNITRYTIGGNVQENKIETINDDTIRYLCLSSISGNLHKMEVITYRYKIFQKK